MTPGQAILATLAALPHRRIDGRKRLQKLVCLLQLAGADIETEFKLLHYGPYSPEVANAADLQSLIGNISEDVNPIGVFGTYQSVYTLADETDVVERFDREFEDILTDLDEYSTVVLEVASTVGFLMSQGQSFDEALEFTKRMKPNKANAVVLNKTVQVLERVGFVAR